MTDPLITPMSDEELRNEVRSWLAENWKPDTPKPLSSWDMKPETYEWLKKVVAARWAAPTWPVEYFGRNLSKQQGKIVKDEFSRVNAFGTNQDKTHLAANTLLTFGQHELKMSLIPQLLDGSKRICLLYSEPGAGSDLAGIRCRADRDGDDFVITGQKVWTSGALTADYGLLIARTDWDVPKHKGISFFFCPMKQEQIDVRPLHQITGESHFNEVFIDGARVPAVNLLGTLNEGWKVLQTALAYERSIMGEGAGDKKTTKEFSFIDAAREAGCLDDPLMRQEIAQVIAYRKLNQMNMERAKADMAQGTSSPIMSLGKLAMSRILHEEARVRLAILEPEGLMDGDDHELAQDANYRSLNAYMTSIGGGTDQIQRNIIGERVLGLPREPELDRDVPFKTVKAN